MSKAEIDLLAPIMNAWLAVQKYETNYGEDVPYELAEMHDAANSIISSLSQEGTLEDKKEFFNSVLTYIPAVSGDPENVNFLVRMLYRTHVAFSFNDERETHTLDAIKEKMDMRDFAMKALSPHLEWLVKAGHPLQTDTTTCITQQFCLVANNTAILREGNDLVIYDGQKEPKKYDPSLVPDADDDTAIIAHIFHKVVTGENKPTDCAREIVKALDWKPREILAFNGF